MAVAADAVTVYTTTTCPWCTRTKEYLRQKDVPFQEKNIEYDRAAAQEVMSRSGQMGVPVTIAGDDVIVGFDRARLDQLAAKIRRPAPARRPCPAPEGRPARQGRPRRRRGRHGPSGLPRRASPHARRRHHRRDERPLGPLRRRPGGRDRQPDAQPEGRADRRRRGAPQRQAGPLTYANLNVGDGCWRTGERPKTYHPGPITYHPRP